MSARRITIVTLSLAAVGALFGGLFGAVLGFVMGVVRRGQPVEGAAMAILTTGAGGAALGAVLMPVSGWLLLRHVPLGRALGYATLGTMAGAAIGLAVGDEWWLGGALIGFTVAAIWLRLFTKAAPTPAIDTPAPEDPAG